MPAAPPGSLVRLYYDGRPLAVGDVLQTASGRLYGVYAVRLQECGKHTGRQHLQCVVLKSAPDDARVVPLFWYRRRKKGERGRPHGPRAL